MQKHIIIIGLLLLIYSSVHSQKIIVGVVSNMYDTPIGNVKVSSVDNPTGVFTNKNGEYKIEVASYCDLLEFTYEDNSYEEIINDRTVLNKMISEKTVKIRTESYRFNIMLNAGGAIVWGAISGSVMLTDFMSIDVGLGLGKIYAGSTFYLNAPFKNKNWQPYLGANIGYFEEFMGPTSTLTYIPVGLRFLNYKGTSFSFELAGMISNNEQFLLETPIWGGIKFGKYF